MTHAAHAMTYAMINPRFRAYITDKQAEVAKDLLNLTLVSKLEASKAITTLRARYTLALNSEKVQQIELNTYAATWVYQITCGSCMASELARSQERHLALSVKLALASNVWPETIAIRHGKDYAMVFERNV